MEEGTPEQIWSCRLDTSGRIVIPQAIRAAREWNSGDELAICRRGDEFFLQRTDELIHILLASFRNALEEGEDLVEELLSERREEATREA